MERDITGVMDTSVFDRPGRRAPGVILIVDDDPSICELLRDFLESLGFAVITARNGSSALAKIARARPTLIITDLSMPVMDGAELCQVLARAPDTADIPRVLMSAWQTQLTRCARERCAHGYLPKPFDLDALEQIVTALLN